MLEANNLQPIGVLALQGNFAAHIKMCNKIGVAAVEVREVAELHNISALIIPGGESSALLKLMQPQNFIAAIQNFYHKGGAIFGTCAGLILLAKKVLPQQDSLSLLNVTVERNAYGRQLESFVGHGELQFTGKKHTLAQMVFIRAPKITAVGSDVLVIASLNGDPVLVAGERVLGCSFHPEMSDDPFIHQYFIDNMVGHERA